MYSFESAYRTINLSLYRVSRERMNKSGREEIEEIEEIEDTKNTFRKQL
jgi:hypothetical protein